MIEGCIVAKLVFGYLKDEGFNRTCSTFQEECSYFQNGNKEIDMVLLTADLKTILDDYSRPKEAGKENTPVSTAVIKSLWKELDILIGQLKYATIPSVPQSSLSKQSVRAKRTNLVARPRRNYTPTSQANLGVSPRESLANSAFGQKSTSLGLRDNNSGDKLPLPRYLSSSSSRGQLSQLHQNQAAKPQSFTLTQAGVRPHHVNQVSVAGSVNTIDARVGQRVMQMAGCSAVHSTLPSPHQESQACNSVNNLNSSISATSGNPKNSLSMPSFGAGMESAFQAMETESCNDTVNNVNTGKGGKVLLINPSGSSVFDSQGKSNTSVAAVDGHLSLGCNPSQDELHLKSPKRKCIQPKKRTVLGDAVRPSLSESPMKSAMSVLTSSTEVSESWDNSVWDVTPPQYFLDKLLNTPLLQEKLAENINKVFGSSRQLPNSEEENGPSSDVTVTEVSSRNNLVAESESSGTDIPVEDIMEQMQADPAFDALFSMFGLDALSESALTKECEGDSVIKEILTPTRPCPVGASASSSTASELHLSATDIVTDALLLLAGSPQKPLQPGSLQSTCSSTVPHSKNQNPVTPPLQTQPSFSAGRDKCLVTELSSRTVSGLSYVRALDFSLPNGGLQSSEADMEKKVGRKKGSSSRKGLEQRTLQDKSSQKASLVPTSRETSGVGCSKSGSDSRQVTSLTNQTVQSIHTLDCLANTSPGPFTNLRVPHSSFIGAPSAPTNLTTAGAHPVVCHTTLTSAPVASPISYVNMGSCVAHSIGTFQNTGSSPSRTDAVISRGPSPVRSAISFTTRGAFPTHSPTSFTFQEMRACHVPNVSVNPSSAIGPLPVNLTIQETNLSPHEVACSMSSTISTPVSLGAPCHVVAASQHPGSRSSTLPICVNPDYTSICPFSKSPYVQLYKPAMGTTTTLPSPANFDNVGLHPELGTSHCLKPTPVHGYINGTHLASNKDINSGAERGSAASLGTSMILTSSPSMPCLSEAIRGSHQVSTTKALSLQASNRLQTLALQHKSSKRNSTDSVSAEQKDTHKLPTEKVQGLDIDMSLPLPQLGSDKVCLKEKLAAREPSKDKKKVSVKEQINVNTMSQVESVCKEPVVSENVPDVNDSQKRNNSTAVTRENGCCDLVKENSTGFTQTGITGNSTSSDLVDLGGKRRRDTLSQHKEKTKNSRAKRSRTKDNSICFPKNLNVDEFLSKLYYEEK